MTGRGRARRRLATLILLAAVGLDALVIFLFVSGPQMIGPMRSSPPPHIWIVPALGILLNAAGVTWMVRVLLSTRDAERHRSFWRFRP